MIYTSLVMLKLDQDIDLLKSLMANVNRLLQLHLWRLQLPFKQHYGDHLINWMASLPQEQDHARLVDSMPHQQADHFSNFLARRAHKKKNQKATRSLFMPVKLLKSEMASTRHVKRSGAIG